MEDFFGFTDLLIFKERHCTIDYGSFDHVRSFIITALIIILYKPKRSRYHNPVRFLKAFFTDLNQFQDVVCKILVHYLKVMLAKPKPFAGILVRFSVQKIVILIERLVDSLIYKVS